MRMFLVLIALIAALGGILGSTRTAGASTGVGRPVAAELNAVPSDFIESEAFYLAATIWGEARGDGEAGMQAVAYVIANRIRGGFRTDGTIRGTVTRPAQFTCWTAGDANRSRLTPGYLEAHGGAEWQAAKRIARQVMREGVTTDTTGGARFYHADYVAPRWADASQRTARVGRHIFYAGSL